MARLSFARVNVALNGGNWSGLVIKGTVVVMCDDTGEGKVSVCVLGRTK